MEIIQLNAEGFAAVEIIHKGIVGLGMLFWIFLREVDKVGAVREDMACCIVFMLGAEGAKVVSMVVLEGWILPFAL